MTIRVAAVGTGNVGKHALKQLVTNPDYELTGVWVSSSAKAGKDAGELAGLEEPNIPDAAILEELSVDSMRLAVLYFEILPHDAIGPAGFDCP